MKKIISLALVAAGLMVSQLSVAGTYENQKIGDECKDISSRINTIVKDAKSDQCIDDVKMSVFYTFLAGDVVLRANYPMGLHFINLAERELKSITAYRPYCSYFVPSLTPILAEVTQIKAEIEVQNNSTK